MTGTFRTICLNWVLVGCIGILMTCTLVSGICLNYEITKKMCDLNSKCNNGICIVDITSTDCNVSCSCTGGYQGKFCKVSPTDDVTIKPNSTSSKSTVEPTAKTTAGGVTIHASSSTSNSTEDPTVKTTASGVTIDANRTTSNSTEDPTANAIAGGVTIHASSSTSNSTDDPTVNTPTPITMTTSLTTTPDQVTAQKKCGETYTCDHGYCDDTNQLPCTCESGWVGTLCELSCNLTCMNNGTCKRKKETNAPECNCLLPYTGPLCDMLRTTVRPRVRTIIQRDEADYRYIAGVVVGAVLFVVLIASILCLILWKRRAIIILKLIHWFKPYEDDDCKLYDAFISYKSSHPDGSHRSSHEELFVINTLMPKLEQELGFRLCVHFRDFLPGRHITENVLDAIENSRRTIMLLSKNYIENSFWTQFEYEQAQVAAMERKQRIIPIILEDISDAKIQDHTLRIILDSITYTTWPGMDADSAKINKFWTKLTLSMPKLMPAESVTSVSYTETDESSYVGIEDAVVSKVTVSNGPYTTHAAEHSISVDISHDESNNQNDTDLMYNTERMGDKKDNGTVAGHDLREENLKAKAQEYVEILEGGI